MKSFLKSFLKCFLWHGAAFACAMQLSIGAGALHADEAVPVTPSVLPIASTLATKTVFAKGFGEPQGITYTGGGKDGNERNFAVTDYQKGEVVILSLTGERVRVLASGLKNPSQIVTRQMASVSAFKRETTSWLYVTERKANRVIEISQDGDIKPIGKSIIEPVGLALSGTLYAVSHTTSKIYCWVETRDDVIDRRREPTGVQSGLGSGYWQMVYAAPSQSPRYGFRSLINDSGTLFFTDEAEGSVWMLSHSGKIARFANGLGDPSGLAVPGGKDNALYVCDESNGGRLLKLDTHGQASVVATELGRPRGLLFLDYKTLLIANRDGNIWKVTLP